jgi:DNA-directed RNA polymerase subunit L
MELIVDSIKIKEINFAKKLSQLNKAKNKSLKNALKYIEYLNDGDDGKAMLPSRSKYAVDFVISGTNTGFANGIRKRILDEILIFSITLDDEDIETDDRFILADDFQKCIERIPILQEIDPDEFKTWKLTLNITNSTDEVISVKSGDIEISQRGEIIPTGEIMSANIPIMELHSINYLKISKMKIIQGLPKVDASKFAPVSNTRYEILDMVPLAHDADDEPGVSSMKQNPSKFHIGYTTYRNVKDPKTIIFRCCDSFTLSLTEFLQELGVIEVDKTISHFSEILDVETRGPYTIFHFKEESWTLVNMLAKYCFLLDPEIPIVTPAIIHPSTEIGVIKIRHSDPIKIMIDAVSLALTNIHILREAFENYN